MTVNWRTRLAAIKGAFRPDAVDDEPVTLTAVSKWPSAERVSRERGRGIFEMVGKRAAVTFAGQESRTGDDHVLFRAHLRRLRDQLAQDRTCGRELLHRVPWVRIGDMAQMG
jgi:hypothetical protein